ncbi:MAG TPA: efflux RND transporter periplasmic adaptor subunit, partial [Gemmatimonadaceae bacterium]|nr:efflux RND transporter periplasmic adaptor subunit [Gemmatimonadaceae bacterium]
QVSGSIAKLNADFNSRVHKGDVVALIEPSLFQGALLQASADSASAAANVTAAEAGVEKTRAALGQAKADYDRTAALAKEKLETQVAADLAKSTYDAAAANVRAAVANVAQAKAQLSQKSAAAAVARITLDHTVIRSPIDGIVVARNVDVGQTVAASLQAPTIFTIAQDLSKMQVYAKTDESDVGRVVVGQPVTFKVDAFPRDTFRGVVRQLRMNAAIVQNVVTYDAIIDFQNPQTKLFPGMTAYVTIPVSSARAALKLPNAALRYKPPLAAEEIRALYAKFGIDDTRAAGGASPGDASTAGSAAPARAPGPARGTPAREHRSESAIVWRLRGRNTIEPVKVALGITDHAYTEVIAVLKGELTAGDDVVTVSIQPKSSAPGGTGVRR